MRPVCHLHIGMNKAGSSAIQAALAAARDLPVEVLRPGGSQAASARALTVGFRDRPPSHFVAPDADPATQRIAARQAVEAALAASDRPAVLSSEYLSDFPARENVADLLETVSRHAREVRVLCYLRPPRGYLRSALQQLVKHSAPPPDLKQMWPAYKPRLVRWVQAAGRENVTFVAFRGGAFAGGTLLSDMAARLGLDAAALPKADGVNAGLSAEATAVLAHWHRARGAAGRPRVSRGSAALVAEALRDFGPHTDWGFHGPRIDAMVHKRRRDVGWAAGRTGCDDFADERVPAFVLPDLETLIGYGRDLSEELAAHLDRAGIAAGGGATLAQLDTVLAGVASDRPPADRAPSRSVGTMRGLGEVGAVLSRLRRSGPTS